MRTILSARRLALVLTGVLSAVPAVPAAAGPGELDQPRPALETQAHPAQASAFAGWQYVPATITVRQGQSFTFGNYDPVGGMTAHSLDEAVPACSKPPYTGADPGQRACRLPRFSSGLVDHLYVNPVHGVESLARGTYEFTCQVHSFMRGTLVVE